MTTVWLGTAGWSYLPDWVGPFYPPGTSSSEALHRYLEAFRFVEVDATFYAPPAPTTISRWADALPADSRMSFKAPKALVQETLLQPPEVPFGHFCGSLLDALGPRLARIVVQMQPSFLRRPHTDAALRTFLGRWSEEVPLAVELRHRSWHHEDVQAMLREHDVPMIGTDLHDVPDLPRRCFDTSDTAAYIRLIGHHDGMDKDRIQRPQDDARQWWVEQVAALAARGVEHVYVVVNNHYEGHSPATLRTLASELTAAGVAVAPSTGWPSGQTSLF